MTCLSPVNNFAFFYQQKIDHFSQLYPQDFNHVDLRILTQLDSYIHDLKMHSEFSLLKEISDFSKKLVKTRRCEGYKLVYKLLTLVLGGESVFCYDILSQHHYVTKWEINGWVIAWLFTLRDICFCFYLIMSLLCNVFHVTCLYW